MSGEYRDELGAALARIAELEEKLRIVTEEAAPTTVRDGRFPELEARVARLQKDADADANARRRTFVSMISVFFPLLGGILSWLHQPFYATVCSVVFIALLIYNFTLSRGLKIAKRELVEVEAKLSDVRRIADLEAKLAETKVRVAADEAREESEDDDAAAVLAPVRALR